MSQRTVYAYGQWWSYSEIARRIGSNRWTVRARHQKKGVDAEELFGEYAPEDKDVWRIGKGIGEWRRIREFAIRTTPKTAAQVYGVPEEAVQLAVNSDWSGNRMENWEYLA